MTEDEGYDWYWQHYEVNKKLMITFYEKITMIDYLPTGNFYSYRMQKISEPDQFYDGYKNIEQRVTTLR